jgi:hypothetical protein
MPLPLLISLHAASFRYCCHAIIAAFAMSFASFRFR